MCVIMCAIWREHLAAVMMSCLPYIHPENGWGEEGFGIGICSLRCLLDILPDYMYRMLAFLS